MYHDDTQRLPGIHVLLKFFLAKAFRRIFNGVCTKSYSPEQTCQAAHTLSSQQDIPLRGRLRGSDDFSVVIASWVRDQIGEAGFPLEQSWVVPHNLTCPGIISEKNLYVSEIF